MAEPVSSGPEAGDAVVFGRPNLIAALNSMSNQWMSDFMLLAFPHTAMLLALLRFDSPTCLSQQSLAAA
jgi:hypothetical protein